MSKAKSRFFLLQSFASYLYEKQYSAKTQLVTMVIAITSCLMLIFGAYSYFFTLERLEKQDHELRLLLARHLSIPVAKSLWDYDLHTMQQILDAELEGAVLELNIIDDAGNKVLQRKRKDSEEQRISSDNAVSFSLNLLRLSMDI